MNRTLRLGLIPAALALAFQLRADDKPAAPADTQASLRSDNRQLTDELASAWKESSALKSKLDQLSADYASLRQQLDAAKAQAAPVPDSDATRQLADAQDRLAVSLRSFSVVQDENSQLRASVDKLTADNAALNQQLDSAKASISSLQAQAALTAQIDPLRNELRQSQDEAAALASENAQLKTRLALEAPAQQPAPLRPGMPEAVAAAQPPSPTPTPSPAQRTYVVADGDTLSGISRKFYGTPSRWQDILNANRDVLKDEKSLAVGSTLKIP
ncbi:MAG TPA: LysM peptidoglycan-binding domain-containing protein [Opitutaceae bacterium]|jgi:nucleoid-associated protein YgaU